MTVPHMLIVVLVSFGDFTGKDTEVPSEKVSVVEMGDGCIRQ